MMIFVDRADTMPDRLKPHVPGSNAPLSAGAKELDEVTAIVARDGKPPNGSFYKAYKHQKVRDALLDLFNNKCAYCESTIGGSSQVDVEHYRPKGGISEADAAGIEHHGYWWLAMEWSNLVLSCMHCNQGRRQLIIDPDWTEEEILEAIRDDDRVLHGKLDAFPTEDGVWANRAEDIASEKPLLLDPTVTDPEDHLTFRIDGPLVTMVPKDASIRGRATIDVLGLNRRRLTEDRMRKALTLRNLADKVRSALNRFAAAPSEPEQIAHLTAAREHLDTFARLCRNDQPFSAMGKAMLASLMAEIEAAQA